MPDKLIAGLLAQMIQLMLLVGIISILVAVFKAFFLPNIKGSLGEASINFKAKRFLDQNVYHLIPNVTLPTPDGTTQIDHVIVSRYGIFVVETKNYKGWIYGGERDAKWTQVIYKRKERFQNPLRQNYKHSKTLSDLTSIPHERFKSIVVFAGDSTFKTDMPDNVVHIRNFIRHIKTYQTQIIQDAQVTDISDVIQEWAGTVTYDQKRDHVKHVRAVVREKSASYGSIPPQKITHSKSGTPICPRCNASMVKRTNRKDGSMFWGCPRYPKCRGTRSEA